MRALQALCILSRFVTADIADITCQRVFEAMEKEITHNQIRYFVEIFALQCARKHPTVFGEALVDQIGRRDLSLQMVSSLMIVAGNLIVGRYHKDFLQEKDAIDLHSILAGTIPWLSSTQGFSRAIAQLLTYKIIPLVIDVKKEPSGKESDWYLRSIFRFLEENPRMKRLRKKQSKFFEEYDADLVCTPEGMFSIPLDEGCDADPVHLIDVIKECLVETFEEATIGEQPFWKQIENGTPLSDDMTGQWNVAVTAAEKEQVDNFQRKIIPLDALNLALEDMKERKEHNAAGRRKQKLIVCATLVDKAANLGGLARTSEIFAADRLVIPDIQVTKMDIFKSLSASAGDWIEIEECKEKVSWGPVLCV